MTRPIIVSYYTLRTGYEDEVKRLKQSCEKLELETDIVGIESLGSWSQNCCYKPQFLIEKLQQHQKPIFWVDADAIFFKRPSFVDELVCDLAIAVFDFLPVSHHSRLYTGVLYVQNTQETLRLLQLWDTSCKKKIIKTSGTDFEVWDQICLNEVLISQTQRKTKILHLPYSYFKIFDQPREPNEEVVIMHYQASRRYNKPSQRNVAPFWEWRVFSENSVK